MQAKKTAIVASNAIPLFVVLQPFSYMLGFSDIEWRMRLRK